MVTSKPIEYKDGGPWKRENDEDRNFVLQVKMYPILVEEFGNAIKLKYTNGMDQKNGITT